MIYETGMSLVDDERQTEKPRIEHRAAMSSRGEMQQPEMNNGRRLQVIQITSHSVHKKSALSQQDVRINKPSEIVNQVTGPENCIGPHLWGGRTASKTWPPSNLPGVVD